MKLHILPPSANSHGCLAVFNHLKLSAKGQGEIVNAYGATRTPEFLAMNPCHCCPTLQLDSGDAIWESNAIMRYLCVTTQDGGSELYPTDPVLRAKIDMVLDWRQTSLYKCLPDIAYGVWGMEVDDNAAKKSFAELIETHFVTLLTVFLKDKKYCFSDTPTIADLAIAPALTFIMARKHMWANVPKDVKDYRDRVLAYFSDTKENFDMLEGMCAGYTGKGADLMP